MSMLKKIRKKMQKALPGYKGSRMWRAQKKVEQSKPVQKTTALFEEGKKRKLADEKSIYSRWVKYSREREELLSKGQLPRDVYAKAFTLGALEFLKNIEVEGEAQKYVNGAIIALQGYLAFSAAKDYLKAEKSRREIEENLAALRRKHEEEIDKLRKQIDLVEKAPAPQIERPAYNIEKLPPGAYATKKPLTEYANLLDVTGSILLSELEVKKKPKKIRKRVRIKKLKKPRSEHEKLFYTIAEKSPEYAREMLGVMKHITSHPEKYPNIVVQSAKKISALGEAVGIKPDEEISPSEHFKRMLQAEDLLKPTGQLEKMIKEPTSLTILRTLAELGRKKGQPEKKRRLLGHKGNI